MCIQLCAPFFYNYSTNYVFSPKSIRSSAIQSREDLEIPAEIELRFPEWDKRMKDFGDVQIGVHLRAELEKYAELRVNTANLTEHVRSQCGAVETRLRPLRGVRELTDLSKLSSLDFVDLYRLTPDKQKEYRELHRHYMDVSEISDGPNWWKTQTPELKSPFD
eukprot:984269_1